MEKKDFKNMFTDKEITMSEWNLVDEDLKNDFVYIGEDNVLRSLLKNKHNNPVPPPKQKLNTKPFESKLKSGTISSYTTADTIYQGTPNGSFKWSIPYAGNTPAKENTEEEPKAVEGNEPVFNYDTKIYWGQPKRINSEYGVKDQVDENTQSLEISQEDYERLQDELKRKRFEENKTILNTLNQAIINENIKAARKGASVHTALMMDEESAINYVNTDEDLNTEAKVANVTIKNTRRNAVAPSSNNLNSDHFWDTEYAVKND
jgi:hypothetical protein